MMQKTLAALGGAAAAAAALAAGPAVAQAVPTVQTPACVAGVATLGKVPFVASGFTPGATVNIALGGQFVATGTADATGTLRGVGTPPFFSDSIRHKAFSLTATDGTLSATPKSVLVTHVGVKLPTHLRPTRKARWRAYGFIPRRRVYLFVRRHGHTLGRFSLGKAKGACGDVSKRMRGMPLRHYTTGHYQFWFAQSKRYSKRTRIVGYDITIFRTFA